MASAFDRAVAAVLRRQDKRHEAALRALTRRVRAARSALLPELSALPPSTWQAGNAAPALAIIDRHLGELGALLGRDLSDALGDSWANGVALWREPFDAVGIPLGYRVPPETSLADARAYAAVVLAHRVQEAAAAMERAVRLALLGRDGSAVAADVAALLSGTRRKAAGLYAAAGTITVTEMGRAFSLGSHAQMPLSADAVDAWAAALDAAEGWAPDGALVTERPKGGGKGNIKPKILPDTPEPKKRKPRSTYKRWVAVIDARTRPSHRAINGTVVGWHDEFVLSGTHCQGPHDARLPKGEVINCRCRIAPADPTAD